jgi:hypothetical protein
MSAGQSAPLSPPLRVYRRSPVRRLVLAAACLTLAAIAGSALLREGPAGAAAVLGFALLGAVWCVGSAWWTWRYSTDALRLDPEGFTLVKGSAERRVLWREVPSRFRAVRLWFDTVIAWSTDGSDPPNGPFRYHARAARGLVQAIPGDFHWNPYLLARALNEARRRALAEG